MSPVGIANRQGGGFGPALGVSRTVTGLFVDDAQGRPARVRDGSDQADGDPDRAAPGVAAACATRAGQVAAIALILLGEFLIAAQRAS